MVLGKFKLITKQARLIDRFIHQCQGDLLRWSSTALRRVSLALLGIRSSLMRSKIVGHAHVTIQPMQSPDSTALLPPDKFSFFKGFDFGDGELARQGEIG